ncbi:MAG: hypothetical protein SFW36_00650 [Leptolyngbyaceae cyanobacterium bins.59]|nr:hypothetical protein [Leptolyngbyaceae cyanobacterium bins.59]
MTRLRCLASVLLLTSVLYSGIGFTFADRTLASSDRSALDTVIARRNEDTPRKIRPEERNRITAILQVKQDLAKRLGSAAGNVRVVETTRQTWPDGCLGIPDPLALCTQALVPGWRMVAEANGQRFVYRTNLSGSIVKFDQAASQTTQGQGLQPIRLNAQEMPQPLTGNVVFRAIASGGITGRHYATLLLRDGRLVRVPVDAQGWSGEGQVFGRVSRQQIRAFEQLLQQQKFVQFHGWSYPAPAGAADFITITLSSRRGTIQYADIVQEQLPASLRSVIQMWNQMTRV